MSKEVYCDTCIIMDLLKNRKSKTGRSLGEEAGEFFTRTINCEFSIVLSTFTFQELDKHMQIEEYNLFLETLKFKNKLKTISYTNEDKNKAKKLKPDHFQDALHIILAEKSKCDYLITQNLVDFITIPRNIPVKKPMEI